MALVLGMEEGQTIWIDDIPITLQEIVTPMRYRFKVVKENMNTIFEINEHEKIEILPEVFLQAGRSKKDYIMRLAITAPKQRLIERQVIRDRRLAHQE